MKPECEVAADSQACLSVLIVSEVRFLRESLAETLPRFPGIRVCGQSATLADGLDTAEVLRPTIVLLDVAFPGSRDAVAKISPAAFGAHLVALAISETAENVLAWAEAGVDGYVPNTASLDELVSLLRQIHRGEQTCSPRVAGSLLRHASIVGRHKRPNKPSVALTRREFEILGLLREGLSNKNIARRLGISLGTTKSHVHNLLGKLSIQRRVDATRVLAFHPSELMSPPVVHSILSPSFDR
jgi:DNA-binding NarL/FixJ family response regulator